ncbi:MAG: polysulfide reductase [Candidatus Schekmanbacteria bacterium RIFCSPHIGHO2_02_FULL_38_11]|uniref:Polysulfide reductase n=1 Tax=Candidatus Schekmanbacteria bacterium RIFCSPLOWO2_12_FULL_38_15 TaxID=1817883 RepID=A0A1F7SEJ1_9BACT|nr:MAG: polysulfide reductase [Candidatus Schekmanbacteria bacterium GWA2_38_9]OGL49461.1 MAG: polysulfide reductase [Candidatus Schekmanbacteria bacterium RIFCSPLOWO2_02_FULL_38_14]OGL52175.1 MAG: polysulfide reductase [Candidatus Schekmanbacteria bacterium RIFCSPLOWO2_12_FULL_38_15]OGL53571.1 MAG: polysulfide reductase [Candidatus Schekmanbacteria bacterium RIFCSPHIGHO2_02_FULL_38_11]
MRKIELPKITFWRVVLAVIMVLGVYATGYRFIKGLGASTALSDSFPWGLWIGFDVLCGVGLAAGGFTITAAVYIFNIKKYKPIIRSTILTAFLGYILVSTALLYDLGRPYRIWHPIVMWNPHSVMFEVAWCVMLYSAVLALEFIPVILEKFNMEKPLKILKSISIPLVLAGFLLSTLHQSSLGTLFLIVPEKLNGLWYSPLLPLFFFVSAIGAGLAMVIFESFLSYRFFKKELEIDLLEGLSRVIVVILGAYFALRMLDLFHRDAIGLVFNSGIEGPLFIAEILVGVVIPFILLTIPQVRVNKKGLFISALMVVIGFVMNRLNVSITGMAASSGVEYFPTWMEMAVTAFIVGIGFIVFGVAVKYLPIFEAAKEKEAVEKEREYSYEALPGEAALAIESSYDRIDSDRKV